MRKDPTQAPLTREQREKDAQGRLRKRVLSRNSIKPLTEGRPTRLYYGPGHEYSLKNGITSLQALALDQPVYLVRRRSSHAITVEGKDPLHYLLVRKAWDQIKVELLVPGVTMYAARVNLSDGPALIIVDPVPLDWKSER